MPWTKLDWKGKGGEERSGGEGGGGCESHCDFPISMSDHLSLHQSFPPLSLATDVCP